MWGPLSPAPLKPMLHPSFSQVRRICFPPRMFPFSDIIINQMSSKFSGVWGKCTLYQCFRGNPIRWLTQKIMCVSWPACKEFLGYVCAKRFCSGFSARYSKQVSFCLFFQTSNILVAWLDSGEREDLKSMLQSSLWAGKMNSLPQQMEINYTSSKQEVSCSFILLFPRSASPPYLQCCQNSVSGSWWSFMAFLAGWSHFGGGSLNQFTQLSWVPSCLRHITARDALLSVNHLGLQKNHATT